VADHAELAAEDRMIETAPATLAAAIEWMKLMLLDCLHE
jgi:hypothetical protein